ncbi:BC1872 family protein [Evansella tamaricis]|uniref:Phage ABA sandwich domain-containing protein n=1 Tax=Evansella tamaricis TaxID=2069301 RepID=A0ABS6JL69_9BACI|nr:hypothetical protein [Evansella tamaricis]MBU9713048.1 hypothetical protein [Evansella tamaricis]
MDKIEIIARRILGWKLNRSDRWYNPEEGIFIPNFQPEDNLEHAMMIVERLECFGFQVTKKSDNEVYINNIYATGETLPKAITNAAFKIAENNPIPQEWM